VASERGSGGIGVPSTTGSVWGLVVAHPEAIIAATPNDAPSNHFLCALVFSITPQPNVAKASPLGV
jgi:hypothetical protein